MAAATPTAAINYAESYNAALEQAYSTNLHFFELRNAPANTTYEWVNARIVNLPTLSTRGRADATRDDLQSFNRNATTDWTPYQVTFFRKWQTLLHPTDINQTNMALTIGRATSVFNTDHKFPEMDAYLISKLYADWEALDNTPITETVTTNNVLNLFNSMMTQMDEDLVPQQGRVLYVSPTAYQRLIETTAVSRGIDLRDGRVVINQAVASIDGVPIHRVPQRLMQTLYTFGNYAEGLTVAPGARAIQMVLGHNSCVATPVIHTASYLQAPSAVSEAKWLYYEESYEDAFVLAHKSQGLRFVVSAA
jgi:hypothetical protein